MTSLSVFSHDFGDATIRATSDKRFSVYDVLVAFGVADKPSNAKNVFDRIVSKNPELTDFCSKFKFSGQGQRETPVATQDVCEEILVLLGCHPDQAAKTSDKFFPRTESQIVLVLELAFRDLSPVRQFMVHGYRIDLYLAKANIAIEVDEDGHRNYRQQSERDREQVIKTALGCSFVRLDPYAIDFNLGKVIFAIRELIS